MALPQGFDLLIIDDNSPDGTAAIVKEKMEQYAGRVHLTERSGKLGLGTAYITGFRWALERGYEYIFEMDADFSHTIRPPTCRACMKPALQTGPMWPWGRATKPA